MTADHMIRTGTVDEWRARGWAGTSPSLCSFRASPHGVSLRAGWASSQHGGLSAVGLLIRQFRAQTQVFS